jgi:hypothetical protein
VTVGPDDANDATLEKILEESFQDHLAGRRAKGGQTPALIAPQPFSLGRLKLGEQHAPAALAERRRVLVDESPILRRVERPHKGEDQPGQVRVNTF